MQRTADFGVLSLKTSEHNFCMWASDKIAEERTEKFKSQRTRKSAVKLCFAEVTGKHICDTSIIKHHVNREGGRGPIPRQTTTGDSMLRARLGFPRKVSLINQLTNFTPSVVSPWNHIHACNTEWTQISDKYKCVYVCVRINIYGCKYT